MTKDGPVSPLAPEGQMQGPLIIATDNRKTTFHMLCDHDDVLGKKVVRRILTFPAGSVCGGTENWQMILVLGECED